MGSNERDELDILLDRALESYAAAQPRPGLEQRVMANVRAAGKRGRWRLAIWVPALAAVCTAVVLAALALRAPRVTIPAPEPPRVVARQQPAAASPARAPVQASRPKAGRAATVAVRRPAPLPKLEQFPSPAPVSEEVRALLEWTRKSRELARQVLASTEPKPTEPIQIKELTIPPLERGDTSED